MKAKFLWLLKAVLAGCLAFLVLNLFTCIYRGCFPSVADKTMSTPCHYVPNSYFSLMTEGLSIGSYDQNGYNNAYPVQDRIDYLCLGSSQMEATEVMPNRNTVYRLNELLNAQDGSGYAYNIGISGERLPECINRLDEAIDTYRPQKAVILETAALDFPQKEIDEALGETKAGKLQYSYGGILGMIRKLPFLRLAYIQLEELFPQKETADNGSAGAVSSEFDRESYIQRITPLIEQAVKNANGMSVYIFYHPGTILNPDGSVSTGGNPEMIRQFREICEQNGIHFLDMTDRFLQEYEENHILPYGFANTSVGTGHLNSNGHAMIASELYKMITEEE